MNLTINLTDNQLLQEISIRSKQADEFIDKARKRAGLKKDGTVDKRTKRYRYFVGRTT